MVFRTKWPLLISLPHTGLTVPSEVSKLCLLKKEEIIQDSDAGATNIYSRLRPLVRQFICTDVARVIVDLNRAADDTGKDGVIKTHTCYDVPIYSKPLPDDIKTTLLKKYYYPYHTQLKRMASKDLVLAIDCHTMSTKGPPLGPDPGERRPLVCLSNGVGTCPEPLFIHLADNLTRIFGEEISLNNPFKGGYITQHHCREMPWVQLEISRTDSMSDEEKGIRVQKALSLFIMSVTKC